jgi:Domain of unknown function (DU1801)
MAENKKAKAKAGENKTKATSASVSGFIAAIPDAAKRADAKALIKMMQEATGEKPKLWGPSIVGFGSHHYVYESGREGDMPVVAFSPRKPALVLYIAATDPPNKPLLAKLGRHATGKGCLYIKKLADVDGKILETMIARAVARRA